MDRPRLKKRLGQHHLVNSALCKPLVDFLAPSGARVVEVGPGGGVLTRALLDAGARVWGVELDLEWVWELRRKMAAAVAQGAPAATAQRLQPVVMDAARFPWERLPVPTLVAGNLPYNVATHLIAGLLPHHRQVPRAAFLLQREVAERITAQPRSRDYGSLTVLVQCHAEARILGRVRPGSFHPPPKVESAFVGLRLRPPPLPEAEMGAFQALVRLGFGQKRKTLRNALASGPGSARVEAALAELGLPAATRAEELPLQAWLSLWPLLRPEC